MVEHRGYRVIIRRSGEVVVEGRTADGRPPIGRVKAVDRASIGLVFKTVGGWWTCDRISPTVSAESRTAAAIIVVDHVLVTGMPRGLRPFKEAT